jgi:hypothetical protein
VARKKTQAKHHDDFERQMAIAREIMKRDRVALCALALGDQHPELSIGALIEMAKERVRDRDKSSKD